MTAVHLGRRALPTGPGGSSTKESGEPAEESRDRGADRRPYRKACGRLITEGDRRHALAERQSALDGVLGSEAVYRDDGCAARIRRTREGHEQLPDLEPIDINEQIDHRPQRTAVPLADFPAADVSRRLDQAQRRQLGERAHVDAGVVELR